MAQEEDDEDLPKVRPGMVGQYEAGGKQVTRLDRDLHFHWRGSPPDRRLIAGPFTAHWQGRLFVMSPGPYVLHCYAAGDVRLSINGKTLLHKSSGTPAWMPAKAVTLDYGYHPLVIEYRGKPDAAQFGLYWSSEKFQLEQIPDRHLFHDPKDSPDERFEQGQLLARALRCAACHEVPGEQGALTAPALLKLRGNLSPDWIIQWLQQIPPRPPADQTVDFVPRRMPHLAIEKEDARAIAAYLFSVSEPAPPIEPVKKQAAKKPAKAEAKKPPAAADLSRRNKNQKKVVKKPKPRTEPSAVEGETLVDTIGCLACHRVGKRGNQALFGGGDLSVVADKRPDDFFARWLSDPEKINPAHRMPVFALEPLERADLTLYLSSLHSGNSGADARKNSLPTDAAILARGRELVTTHRCGACHQLSTAANSEPVRKTRLTAASHWEAGCFGAPEARQHRPSYSLRADQRAAVKTYLTTLPAKNDQAPAAIDGQFVLAERNCLGCHVRGLSPGIAGSLPALVADKPNLAPMLPALAPPALIGVGDKLLDAALEDAILLKKPRLRPWLAIRMPKFPLSQSEMQALIGHFVDHDRMPDLPTANASVSAIPLPLAPGASPARGTEGTESKAATLLAGSRLVTADGFGCTSCHKIGNSEPIAVAPAAHGTDLTLAGERIRTPWYQRWVRNPARIVPRMEMPAVQQPVPGVLHSNLGEQLAAIWQAVNTPGFNPPQPNPVRTVRSTNVAGTKEPASILTDVMEVGPTQFLKPIVIGLPNRHNVLFDFETGRLAAWWLGDTARERTRGKSWYWESGAASLLPLEPDQSELIWKHAGKELSLRPVGQFAADLISFEHRSRGASFSYRLHFQDDNSPATEHTLTVFQDLKTLESQAAPGATTGFHREVQVEGAAAGDEILFRVLPGDAKWKGETCSADSLAGKPRVTLAGDGTPATAGWLRISIEPDTRTRDVWTLIDLEYRVDLPVDQFIPPPPVAVELFASQLKVVPGYETTVLPLPSDEMPTGLAWRPDGTLVFSSLKGRVCLAHDTNGDGLEDKLVPYSDDLAAPYGVACNGDAIDVINKYGLLRLSGRGSKDHADMTEVVASGWGYTDDYHDWAVGLPRDREGNYYVALPCQQDNRSQAAAYLRSMTLKLKPRDATPGDPRRFTIEPITAGLRFPMGLALNRLGDLFCSDNQGNYTPFNELNHLVAGKRYGFINKLEVKPGFSPPFQPAAVDIPHPWARSVNGICFLDTPEQVRMKNGRDLFGPFEGQVLACEYTTLQLLRMSLEKIGDTYQGAVYPMSRETAAGEPTFEGPICCAVAPDGDIYVGNLRDSAWGAGRNTGSMIRLRPAGELPCGLAEVRARPDGFTLHFTQPVAADEARQAKNYDVVSFRRIPTPAYGGPDVDEQPAKIRAVEVSADRRQVRLALDTLRPGFVYEFQLHGALAPGKQLFPSEAYYTLRQVPK